MNKEPNMSNERKSMVTQIASAVSTVSGLASIAIIVFYGGALAETVKVHEARIGAIEAKGSRSAESHIMLDDARDDRIQARISFLESELKPIPRIEAKLDSLKEKLDEHMKNRP